MSHVLNHYVLIEFKTIIMISDIIDTIFCYGNLMTHDLPQSLIDAIKNNTLIPFVGAGISMGIKDNQDNPIFKSWTNSLLDAVQILKNEKEEAKATRIESGLKIEPIDYLLNFRT